MRRFWLHLITEVGGSARLLGRVLRRSRHVERHAVFQQAHQLANRSAFFVAVTMGFIGAVLILQSAGQARHIIGDLTAIGPVFLQLLIGEFGPVVVALMVAARYGAGVAAELGAMTITDQVDALRMTGADPVVYLVAPRVWGGVLGILPITLLGSAVAYGAGALVAFYTFGIGWDSYVSLRMTHLADLVLGTAKALSFGVAVPLVAARAGLSASGGAPGVGNATTRAVIGGSVVVLALDLVVGLLGYAWLRAT